MYGESTNSLIFLNKNHFVGTIFGIQLFENIFLYFEIRMQQPILNLCLLRVIVRRKVNVSFRFNIDVIHVD